MLKGERREQKRTNQWYKRHLHNNRKALEVLIEAQRQRIRKNADKQIAENNN